MPPDNVIPGIANYYTSVIPNSTPVGTPVVVRVREGRAIKVEGNSNDPVSSGVPLPRIKQPYKHFMTQIELSNHSLETTDRI